MYCYVIVCTGGPEGSTMYQIVWKKLSDTPSTPGLGSKGQNFFFLLMKVVMLHINFKGTERRAP